MTSPRGATSRTSKFLSTGGSLVVQVAPAAPVASRPSAQPRSFAKLLRRPIPATSVRPLGSVGSKASAAMDDDLSLLVSGTQAGRASLAFEVFHTPPFTVPT